MFGKSLLLKCKQIMRSAKLQFSDISDLRELFLEPKKYSLEEMPFKDPFKIFGIWHDEAKECPDIGNSSIVCLATATKTGVPSLRYMFCETFDEKGFRFFTHHTTRKGEELKANPLASMCFFWAPFIRTVTIEGHVERLSDEESDKLFQKRSYESQINMHCSSQTNRVANFKVLTDRAQEIKKKYSSTGIPRPDNFGWYILLPSAFEFWQLKQWKERMRFRRASTQQETFDELTNKGENGWIYEYLEP